MNDTQSAPAAASADEENLAIAVPYADFCAGVPLGRYHMVVNPRKAERYVKHRLFIMGVVVPFIGLGIAMVLWGFTKIGLTLGIIGFVIPRIIKHQAGKILLHLTLNDAKTYYEAINYEIMEVRHSRD